MNTSVRIKCRCVSHYPGAVGDTEVAMPQACPPEVQYPSGVIRDTWTPYSRLHNCYRPLNRITETGKSSGSGQDPQGWNTGAWRGPGSSTDQVLCQWLP